jgi:hypothetical protein
VVSELMQIRQALQIPSEDHAPAAAGQHRDSEVVTPEERLRVSALLRASFGAIVIDH